MPSAYASAKHWDRRTPERLGNNAQVGALFHGRSDTGGPSANALPNRIEMWSKAGVNGGEY